MTWEETIRFIRTRPEYKELVEQSYLEENAGRNLIRFRNSGEFIETLRLVRHYAPDAHALLDLGAGNGISSFAFAAAGFQVTACEPDPGSAVGTGAIEAAKTETGLAVQVVSGFGEALPFEDGSFEIVYARQALHHAEDLSRFVAEAARVLKPGGLLMTARDHVVFSEKDKALFLQTHPLQQYYGGENAFSPGEYLTAIRNAGFQIQKHLTFYDSEINYYPLLESDVREIPEKLRKNFRHSLKERFGSWAIIFPFLQLLELISRIRFGSWSDERRIPGRMNTFIALKNPL